MDNKLRLNLDTLFDIMLTGFDDANMHFELNVVPTNASSVEGFKLAVSPSHFQYTFS